ncbi:MAG: hypothetical protein EOO71_28990, partial [Myxococcaceae bacterium]
LQYDTTVNAWHTCSGTARINASNPCSEYMFLDDSACNLASLNLMHFRTLEGGFDVAAFKHAVSVVLLAQEIIVGFSRYPTERITKNSHDYRPLGLGYANLGALLMATGLPYDSPAGRNYAAAITSLMCGEAYATSARIAQKQGAFAGYGNNAEPMLGVIRKHRKAAYQLQADGVSAELFQAQKQAWDDALAGGTEHGFRNSQVTVLAPTGTIGFMMDCDTTGIEPDIALIKYKKLVGGGMLKIVNQTVPLALEKLGYPQTQAQDIIAYLDKHDTIEGAPHLKSEHLPVFDCAFKPSKGQRSIHWMGHIEMMSAAQPFLSGAISKTVNMPTDSTVEDIEKAYLEAWKSGLKAVAVYRDGCKRTQPLNTSQDKPKASGFTGNPNIPIAKSITDYIFRWLSLKFLPTAPCGDEAEVEEARPAPVTQAAVPAPQPLQLSAVSSSRSTYLNQADAPPCHTCGAITVRSGACYKCANCGTTSGCS